MRALLMIPVVVSFFSSFFKRYLRGAVGAAMRGRAMALLGGVGRMGWVASVLM
jgi:hypothetical protein